MYKNSDIKDMVILAFGNWLYLALNRLACILTLRILSTTFLAFSNVRASGSGRALPGNISYKYLKN